MFHNANTILQKITRQPHGVHSPFLYSFLKKVAFTKRERKGFPKLAGLFYRICYHFNPESILVTGIANPGIIEALEKAAPTSHLLLIRDFDENRIKNFPKTDQIDLAFFSDSLSASELLAFFETVSKHCNSKSVLIIDGIRKSKEKKLAWDEITTHPKPTMIVDFNSFGMILSDHKLSKQLIKVGF
jgi:hypothetical protein